MILIRLDGPKGDPILDAQCNVIGTYKGAEIPGDIQDGDWVRETTDEGAFVSERRWCATTPPPPPQPNTPGNPYFGKRPLLTKDFFALAGHALGARYARLRTDPAFLWIYDVLMKVEFVDVDDKAGQFLAIVGYLMTTNAADGQKLMSAQDITKIMAEWP